MIRLFEQHKIRQIRELDGMWDFCAEGRNYQMPVPSCWEQHPEFMSWRGNAVYTKNVYVNTDGAVRLEFKGVSHTADVYFDGEHVAHHYNAFTPFSTVMKNVKMGIHEIRVEVDNTFGEHSALHIPNDYYTYGGITRPVSIASISDVYIKNIEFTPYMKNSTWRATVKVNICNLSTDAVQTQAKIKLDKFNIESAVLNVGPESDIVILFDSEFENITPWSHKQPQLYMLEAELYANGCAVDDMIERVGFREVSVNGTDIFVNGEKIFLMGFNRHEDYATVGCAIPLQLMVQDMDLMQEAGANALRTCHYPNDERFLDLCDERGILVWEENHARGLDIERMKNPNFEQQCEDCIREMIENHYNHPSIIIWGILNECASETEEGRRMYKKQYEQIKGMDTTRPTTSATCRHFTDICLDLPDIVSFNMYSGWYQDCDPKQRNDLEIEWIKKSGGDNKPIIVSELGAGAVYGYRDRARCKWSEERQADIIRENLEVYMNDDNISGVFIWQFADCRVTEEGGWFATRARTHNNKGVVDEYRRPKIAFDTVKEIFNKKEE